MSADQKKAVRNQQSAISNQQSAVRFSNQKNWQVIHGFAGTGKWIVFIPMLGSETGKIAKIAEIAKESKFKRRNPNCRIHADCLDEGGLIHRRDRREKASSDVDQGSSAWISESAVRFF